MLPLQGGVSKDDLLKKEAREAAGSSPVVPASFFKQLTKISSDNRTAFARSMCTDSTGLQQQVGRGARFCQDQCAFLLFSAVTEVPLQLYAAQKWLCLYLQK